MDVEKKGVRDSRILLQHREARDNPFGWEAYMVVCAFSADGHRIRFTQHPFEEGQHGEGKG